MKNGKLSSFMAHIINRRALIVVISFSALLLGGCSGVLGVTPREQANDAIVEANESIAEHNKLFEKARDTYAEVKQQIEAGRTLPTRGTALPRPRTPSRRRAPTSTTRGNPSQPCRTSTSTRT